MQLKQKENEEKLRKAGSMTQDAVEKLKKEFAWKKKEMEDSPQPSTTGLQLDLHKKQIYLLVGRCGSGKSELWKRILYEGAKVGAWDNVIVWTGHEYNDFWKSLLPERNVRLFSAAAVLDVFRKVKAHRKSQPDAALQHTLMCFDDCQGYFQSLKYRPEWLGCLNSHRHAGFSLAFIGQHATFQQPSSRSLVGTAFLFRAVDLNSQKHLFILKAHHHNKIRTRSVDSFLVSLNRSRNRQMLLSWS